LENEGLIWSGIICSYITCEGKEGRRRNIIRKIRHTINLN
jgi:hypothetical protein